MLMVFAATVPTYTGDACIGCDGEGSSGSDDRHHHMAAPRLSLNVMTALSAQHMSHLCEVVYEVDGFATARDH